MAKETYELTVASVTRRLPILRLNDQISIASFIMLGDIELTKACARELAEKVPAGVEAVITAETKGIPIAAELADALGLSRYIVARKSVKAYMQDVLWTEDISITTAGVQKLCLDGVDRERVRGKKVLLVDDVISTGGSMSALHDLAGRAGAHIVGEACVLAEGDAAKRGDIIYLETLPLFANA